MNAVERLMVEELPHIVLHLPRPPSANELWIPVRDRRTGHSRLVKSRSYKTWKLGAGLMVNVGAHGDSIPSAYAERFVIPPQVDIDNLSKPLGDILQTCGIVKNDRMCVRMVVDRDRTMAAELVRVELWRVDV